MAFVSQVPRPKAVSLANPSTTSFSSRGLVLSSRYHFGCDDAAPGLVLLLVFGGSAAHAGRLVACTHSTENVNGPRSTAEPPIQTLTARLPLKAAGGLTPGSRSDVVLSAALGRKRAVLSLCGRSRGRTKLIHILRWNACRQEGVQQEQPTLQNPGED